MEATVLNHHGFALATTESLVPALRALMAPSVSHGREPPAPGAAFGATLPRPDVFALAISEVWRQALGGWGILNRLSSEAGHIVLRVTDGGASVHVIIVDHSPAGVDRWKDLASPTGSVPLPALVMEGSVVGESPV